MGVAHPMNRTKEDIAGHIRFCPAGAARATQPDRQGHTPLGVSCPVLSGTQTARNAAPVQGANREVPDDQLIVCDRNYRHDGGSGRAPRPASPNNRATT
jgi:hypothetical protein